jgi:hypothetical protein
LVSQTLTLEQTETITLPMFHTHFNLGEIKNENNDNN